MVFLKLFILIVFLNIKYKNAKNWKEIYKDSKFIPQKYLVAYLVELFSFFQRE